MQWPHELANKDTRNNARNKQQWKYYCPFRKLFLHTSNYIGYR